MPRSRGFLPASSPFIILSKLSQALQSGRAYKRDGDTSELNLTGSRTPGALHTSTAPKGDKNRCKRANLREAVIFPSFFGNGESYNSVNSEILGKSANKIILQAPELKRQCDTYHMECGQGVVMWDERCY